MMNNAVLLDNAKKLAEATELAANNDNCVVLKVKEGREFDLIALGVFSGNETMLRLTKGTTVTCTLFNADKSTFSWHWGAGGHTLVSQKTEELGRIIQTCIEQVYKIRCKW